ncbi:DUF1738 domain-containing protein [Xanthomonas euvesicatoria]|uniref:zincin-like metallopeptidase domain-containing protein n=1 Tax=Xanthomonas euvesicatoria TaxID=456327 RepID=UPI001C495D31|nr:zincin-like metallopeptidase domain-containing protein [Xanthomonas euvesicatoria]MBV6885854.1 DUF1738 domain-containing protein [Xanthomonas campestris pv. euphorbiae]
MPITKAEAQGVTRAFVRDYPGALELAYKFREDPAELYGPRAAEVPADMKGGYVPKETLHAGRAYRGRVDVPLQNVESAGDLLMTLRHEVLGHYGANTFAPGEKRALLDGLGAARNEPTLKPLWDDVNRRYAGQSLDVRAEEVFALHCEGIEPSQHQVADQVQQRGQQSFTETCIARVRPMQADDLHNIVCMVAQGLRDRSRTQQNFPQFNELFRRDENMEPKKPFHEVVAEKLIEQLKAGTAPWQKPWEPGEPNAYLPMNPTTGKRYKGINAIHLMAQGRSDARWMTYKQAAAVGAQVRKGEKGTPVQYWKFSEEQDKLDDNGRPVLDAKGQPVKETVMLERPRVFFATVFNGEQIDGLPPLQPKKEQTWNAVERAEHILKASGATITHAAGDRAFYRPSTDSITLPERGQFPSSDRYYATALHELGHWTGHASRLDRDLAHPFGSEGYAKEELRAEIASMIVGDELGIGHDPGQHAAYVGSWIKALQDEPLEVFRAAADAEKIHDYVLAFEQKQVQEQDQQQSQAQDEAVAQALAVDIAEVLDNPDVSFSHYQAFQGDTLEGALRSRGLETVGSITGTDPEQFYAVAHDRLSPVFGIDPSHTDTDNAYLERKGLAQGVANMAEQLHLAQQAVADQEANMTPPTNDQAAALLAAHPADVVQGIEQAAAARRQLAAGEIDGQAFAHATRQHLGVELPPDWSGELRIVGVAEQDGQTVDAAQAGIEPQAFQVYARKADAQFGEDAFAFVAGTRTEGQAEALAERLHLVDALGTDNQHERAAKLARVQEERVQRDPNATEKDISWLDAEPDERQFMYEADDAEGWELASLRAAELERQERERQQAQLQAEKPERQYINVPYREKDEAKGLGARWDRQQQSWYVPPGTDTTPFAKWAQGAATAAVEPRSAQPAPHAKGETQKPSQQAQQARQYLAVPYEQRNAAKAAGALWDKAAKSWYVGPRADAAKLERWKPENVQAQQGPAMTPREEFAEAMRSAGLFTGSNAQGDHPIMDGKRHRVPVEGGKKGALDGFYVGHLDGHPAGRIINNKTGTDITWKSKGYALSDQEKAKLQAEAAEKLAQRAVEQDKAQEATAQRVGRQMADLVPIEQPTPYLQAKGIQAQAGVMTDRECQKTYIPAFDAEGKQWTMQYIQEDGTKRFAKDSKKEGCFHPVGGMDALAAAPALVISEGYATAAQVAVAVGHATVAAFDSGNLEAVAKALHAKFPDKPVIIAGDDDRHLVMTHGNNLGRGKAEAAAQAVGGKAIFPIFAPAENTYPRDLPAITPDSFKTHLRAEQRLADAAAGKVELAGDEAAKLKASMLSGAQIAALSTMKQHTDFNDLAHKSELGIEGVKRQIGAAISQVQRDEQQHQEQKHVEKKQQQIEQRPRRAARIG